MLRGQLLVLTFSLCVLGVSVSASERQSLPDASQPQSDQPERQADNAPPSTPASEPQADGAQAPLSSPPLASDPPPPLAADPSPPPAPVGFAREFAERLAAEGKLSAADRADRAALLQFYEARLNEPVWVAPAGLTPPAEAIVAEFGRADEWGLDASAFRLPALASPSDLTREQRADAEIALSLAVLKYARHARGGRIVPSALSRNLDRRPQLLDPQHVVEAAARAEAPDAYLRSLHPQHPQFERLRQHYLALRRAAPAAQPQDDRRDGKSAKKRDAGAQDGVSVRKLLVNMEQWRWMPEEFGNFHVWVNIPEYTIRVVRAGRIVHSERVIVGRPTTQTPIFSDEMEQVIFHPFWGVPDSIKKNELLPSLARGNTGVLERNNLRVQFRGRDIDPGSVDWSTADMRQFHVYQPPGGANVLGVVKFRFPNKHDVYMHDTPTKDLFNATVRTFSHGCMRVRDPLRLAELVLAEDRNWPASRIASAVHSGPKDNQINLTRRIPVHMTYFTVWVDDDGRLRHFSDVYGHESRIVLGLEGKAHLIARVRENEPPARTEAVSARGNKAQQDWRRQIFDN